MIVIITSMVFQFYLTFAVVTGRLLCLPSAVAVSFLSNAHCTSPESYSNRR